MALKRILKPAIVAAMGVCLISPISAEAGEITRPDTASDFTWKSTECRRPVPPVDTLGSSAAERLTTYARDIEIYIDCIQREAQRNFQKAQEDMQKAIERDLQKNTQVMNDMMLRAAKTMR